MRSGATVRDGAAGVRARLEALVIELGLDRFAFVTWPSLRDGTPGRPSAVTDYPPAWVSRYVLMRYDLIDPVLAAGLGSVRPFAWGGAAFLRGLRRPQLEMMEAARGHGLGHGLAVPVHCPLRPSGLLVAAAAGEDRVRAALHGAQDRLLAEAWDVWESMSAEEAAAAPSAALTARERECLLWTHEGKTAGETAAILGVSAHTVNRHVSNAARKLGASGKHHAASLALLAGLIRPSPVVRREGEDGAPEGKRPR